MLSLPSRPAGLTAAYYAAIFMAFGAQLPYWPVWMSGWGLSEAEIGFYLGAATLARIVGSTVLPAIADRYAVRRGLVMATTWAAAGVLLLHLAVEDRAVLFPATMILALLSAPSVPLGEALGIRASERFGFAYGPVRAAGSVAFLLANIGVGAWIGHSGPDIVIWWVGLWWAVAGLLALIHPGGGAAASRGSDRATSADLRALARAPVFAVFTLTIALGQGAHVVYYVYSVLDWQAQGISPAVIGWLWAIGVLAETVLMLGPGRSWVVRLGPGRILALAGVAGMLRWSMLALSPGLLWLWPLQGLHALTFGLAHLAAMAFVARAIPPRMTGSAQGVISGVIGGSIQAGALALAAVLAQAVGIWGAYLMAAGMALASAILALVLRRMWTGGPIIDVMDQEPRSNPPRPS